MYLTLLKFQATRAACLLIGQYYEKIGTEARVKNTCLYMYAIYAVWTLVDCVLIVLRVMSLVYMGKSYKFL